MNILEHTTEMTFTQNGYRADWTFLGEGLSGDYDESDPDDEPLLRFDCYKLNESEIWEELDDSSYCTQIPVGTSDEILLAALKYIVSEIEGQENVKRICEKLSWINPSQFELNK